MYIYIYARISVVGFPLVLSFLPVCHIPQTPKKHSVWQSSKIFGSWSVHRPIEFWGCKTVHMIIWGVPSMGVSENGWFLFRKTPSFEMDDEMGRKPQYINLYYTNLCRSDYLSFQPMISFYILSTASV